jgi:hypothetical protein
MSPKQWQTTESNEKSEDERLHKMKWMTNMDDKILHICVCVREREREMLGLTLEVLIPYCIDDHWPLFV